MTKWHLAWYNRKKGPDFTYHLSWNKDGKEVEKLLKEKREIYPDNLYFIQRKEK